MIDEAFDTELEARLRAAFDEMIPKLLGAAPVVSEPGAQGAAEVIVAGDATPARGSRRLVVAVVAVVAVAATVLGLIVIAGRDTDRVTPGDGSPATDASPPPWYDLIHASLPERFQSVALTFATDAQLWFVALSPTDGKALEIQLASGGYSAEPTAAVDATGAWVETAQSWSVRTPTGLFVSVACNIGVGGRDFIGPENYCEMTSGVAAYTKDEIRAVANALATSLTLSIFDQNLGTPTGDSIDTVAATALISAAVPGQQISASDLGNGSDRLYDVGGLAAVSASDTLPPAGTVVPAANTSVRILHGVYPSATVTGEAAAALYENAAVVWIYGTGGVAVRISTTDPSPASVTRLEQLAQDLLKLDPNATKPGPSPTINTAVATTTTSDHPVTLGAETTSTLASPTTPKSSETIEPTIYRPVPIRQGDQVTAVIQPIEGVGLDNSSVTLRIVELPDGRFLEADLDSAVVPESAAFWTTEINGGLRGKTTARQGSTLRIRVDRDVYGGSFRVRFSATTANGEVLATTGEMEMVE
jgi:hypothetical protein